MCGQIPCAYSRLKPPTPKIAAASTPVRSRFANSEASSNTSTSVSPKQIALSAINPRRPKKNGSSANGAQNGGAVGKTGITGGPRSGGDGSNPYHSGDAGSDAVPGSDREPARVATSVAR